MASLWRLRVLALLLLQALGIGIWWAWFNGFAFGHSGLAGMILKILLALLALGLWSAVMPRAGERYLGWDREGYRLQDALAGLPFILLPALIPLTSWLAALVKPFPLQLTAFVWMPWWSRGQVLRPDAYAVLLAAGVLLLSAVTAKGVVAGRWLLRTPEARVNPKRLFVLGFFFYLLFLTWPACVTAPRSGEVSQWLVMQALTYDTRLNIDRVLSHGDYFHFHPVKKINFAGHTDQEGRLFLPVAPGMPLLFITFYLLQGRWLISVLLMLFAAGAAAQLYGLLREQGFGFTASRAVWLVCLLNGPLLIYGYQAYEVAAGAFFMLWGLRQVYQIGSGPSQASVSAAALAASLLWLGGIRFVLPSIFIFILLGVHLARSHRSSQWTLAAGVAAVPLITAGYFFATVYAFFLFHPAYVFQWPWQSGFWRHGLGLLADRHVGLLWNGPVWILGLVGLAWLYRQRPVLSMVVAACLAVEAVFAMVFPEASGDGSSFHRFLAPMVPLLGIGLAAFVEVTGRKGLGYKLFLGTVVWGGVVGWVQTLFPFLTTEAARIKLGAVFAPVGWLYGLLPALGPEATVMNVVMGLAAGVSALYAAYALYQHHAGSKVFRA